MCAFGATPLERTRWDRVAWMKTDLTDEDQTRMERNAMVRRLAEGSYVGCEFMDVGHFDKTTGFYVIT